MRTQRQYEAILDVFTTEGWKLILEDIEEFRDLISDISDIQSSEELFKRKGELERLNWFSSLREWYEYSKEVNSDADV